jgi:hypothetical protein
VDELRSVLWPESKLGTGKWVDLAGLFAPEESVQKLLDDIENETVSTLEQVVEAFREMHKNYSAYEWAWAAEVLQRRCGKTFDTVTADDIVELIAGWKEAVVKLDRMLYADAEKEFAATAQIGYGLDGDKETRYDDFKEVRGTFEGNSFVTEIEEHIARKTGLGDELIERMKKLALV